MSWQAVTYRGCDYEVPVWAFANTSSGRYNLANREPATQYLGLHPMTPWAELIRNLDLRDPSDAAGCRFPVWVIRVQLADPPEDITFDTVGSYGVNPEDLVSDDWTNSRRLANALHASGVESFTAPSAALPGTANLILLQPTTVIDFHVEPIDADQLPTALSSRDGRCPQALWDHVHFKGVATEHPALTAWKNDEEFEFEQPAVDTAALRD